MILSFSGGLVGSAVRERKPAPRVATAGDGQPLPDLRLFRQRNGTGSSHAQPRTIRFYDAVLAPLGIELTMAIWQHGLIGRNPSGGAEKAK